ncbi:hypothetical protein [Paenibacillus sp. Soil522]|uniref:hypothetical protein n=1 Tax=Paenibacillus sp. Soil522 TaxID=1736388 RepID=UPI0006F8B6E5|nr:hypothetical protein [Paenibacillus sp. Soil522]KRE35674.1 hypothetical protein ASG81_20775 [Paenibacillus sp. Soil522]
MLTMQREVFQEMEDDALISACFKPLIQTYKEINSEGLDLANFYHKMTSGQQALFIFRTYYSHVIESVQELYWWSAFFMAQEPRWAALNEKMREIEDLEFVALLQDVEAMLRSRNHPVLLTDFPCVSRDDLDLDTELRDFFQSAYERLTQITVRTNKFLVALIRNSPDSFVKWS